MSEYSFEFLKKDEFDIYGPRLFALLHGNMSRIVPSGKSYEEEQSDWLRVYGGAFKGREQRKIVLITSPQGEVVGFFGYCALNETFHMEEIQFSPEIQGKNGIFRSLYDFVLEDLPSGLKLVEAYAHKKNEKSLGILSRLGLKVVGENEAGDCFRLEGAFDDLIVWSNKK